MRKIRIYSLLAAILALLAPTAALHAQTPAATGRILSKMDSLQRAMHRLGDTLAPAQTPVRDTLPGGRTPQDGLSAAPRELTADELLARGDSLRFRYAFGAAVSAYREAARLCDSTQAGPYQDSLLLGQNALSMMAYCSRPVVVAKQRFPLKDFFLYYPLPEGSWRPVPNPLDSLGADGPVRATYFDPNVRSLYYSSRDEDGVRNLYRTHNLDSLWSVPELINEQVTSHSDEIFPMLSPDGKSLYFASRGLYGMGGYDLYMSRWNKETRDWDLPMNMGFPYSSPYDDFLFMNTADGKYSLFASNRECSRDSVYIYVLEYDSMPVRGAVTDEQEVRTLSLLLPQGTHLDHAAAVSDAVEENPETREYMARMAQVRHLRDSIYAFGKALDEERAALARLPEAERAVATASVLQKELALPALNDSLARASAALQQIEMDFLMKGVVIDPSKVQVDAEKEVVGSSSGYVFSKKKMGPPLDIVVHRPKPSFDYTFMILPEGRFAEDNTLPDGIVYQIQIFSSAAKATVKQLKGLSPVFEKLGNTLRYTYSVGLFSSYKDVLSNLNKVRRQGFRSAFITAYNDGKSISVSQARALEKTIRPVWFVKAFPPNGESLPALAITAIHQHTAKDIVKGIDDGAVVFTCGPFEEKDDAEALVTTLRATGVTAVELVEKILQ